MSDRFAGLSTDEKRQLLATLLRQKTRQPTLAPLSLHQEGLWFLDQLEPGNPFYNIACGIRVSGQFDAQYVQKALDEIIRRHETLRTTFRIEGGEAMQVIAPPFAFPVTTVDISGAPEGDQRNEVDRIGREEARTPFDLTRGPLVRATLIRCAPTEHAAVFTIHHIIADGWSIGVFLRELGMLYHAYSTGKPSPLPDLPIQYRNYAQWQRDHLRGETRERLLSYWRQQLDDAPHTVGLPYDRPLSSPIATAGDIESFELPAELSRNVDDLCKRLGVTPFMVLLAVFAVLLHRHSKQETMLIGTPIAGRENPDTQGLIGYLVNTAMLRIDLSGEPTFVGLLARVHETVLGAFAHAELPLSKLVEELHPSRDHGRPVFSPVAFVFQNMPMPELAFPRLKIRGFEIHNGTAKVDLTLYVWEKNDRLEGYVEYNTHLFDRATIKKLIEEYRSLIEELVVSPEQSLSFVVRRDEQQRAALSPQERHKVLVEFNNTHDARTLGLTLPPLFEEQVQRAQNQPAVHFSGTALSYNELNCRANQLAHHLIKRGVGPEVLVGFCLEPSLDVAVAMLGILKAGGAFVPFDPEYPPERLLFMLSDANVSLLLTQERRKTTLPETASDVICVDTEWDVIAHEPTTNPSSGLQPVNLAYVIYTSGSTGRPKGAMITHAGLCNRLLWDVKAYGFDADDRELLHTSLAFDASLVELLGPLIAGAQVVIAPDQARSDTSALVRLIAEEKVSVLEAVPSLLHAMLDEPHIHECRDLRRVISAGEVLHPDLVDQFHHTLKAMLINGYGPTEASVGVTHYASSPNRTTVPIGKPFTNTRLYILDDRMEPVGIGTTGELYIGGACVGRGYLNNPALTAERFVPDPFMEGGRLYRTGDAARFLTDGNVEFLGRLDNQVKLRGFRVELGEIEAVLRQHESVANTAVILREDMPGDQRLVAYIVSTNHEESTGLMAVLKEYLGSTLPRYMVPSDIVVLDRLPLQPSGKIDRGALPGVRNTYDRMYAPPHTETEESLVALWEEVLGVRVGVHDDFFALGGHSLLAMKLISQLRQRFRVELPVGRIFASPTIAGIASIIDELRRSPSASAIPKAPPAAVIPLSHSQQVLWFFEQFEHRIAYNTPLALRLQGQLNHDVLERSLNEISRRHDVLRASIVIADGQPVHRTHEHISRELELHDLTSFPGERREHEAMGLGTATVNERIDLTQPPLLRCVLARLADDHHILFISVHHIIFDGWSCVVFVRELAELYDAFVHGKPSPLPEPSIQFTDYVHWLRRGMHGGAFDEHVAYWNTQLSGELPVLDLPTDRPRSKPMKIEAAAEEIVVPAELTAALKQLGMQEGATLFMTLLAAYGVWLHRYAKQDDVIIGTHAANRTRAETHDLIGFFASFLPLRLDSSGNPTFTTFLQQVREVCLSAFSHLEVPVDRLRAIRHTHDSSRLPVAQAYFSFEDFPDSLEMDFGGMHASPVRFYDLRVSGFDIAVFMREEEGRINGSLVYRTELYDRATVKRMLSHFSNMLQSIAQDPDERIGFLPLPDDEERHEMIVKWNDTKTPLATDALVHQMFEAQAGRSPDAMAIVAETESWTYTRLNERANRIAHRLQRLGVRPESLVAVLMERTPGLVAAILGVLKAGAAYLPLDPRQPPGRTANILRESHTRVMLTDSQLPPLDSDVEVIMLDTDMSIEGESSGNPLSAATPTNLAYVIYTSGSTGQPKGVMVEHRSVANVVQSFIRDYNLRPEDRVLQQASIAFDVSVNEIFPILCVGGAVVMSEGETFEPERLAQVVAEHHVTIFGAAPSVLAGLNRIADRLTGVRLILSGGEALSLSDVHALLEHTTVTNGYGPTETTVCASYYLLEKDSPLDTPTIPIGTPLANTVIHLLDEHLELVPVGCIGEVCIGGAGLARGYLHDPVLTAGKFVPDPFSTGERLFRTGDLAKRLSDGNIVFLGRADDQIKLRGFRIELSEIEASLRQHPSLAEAVVAAPEINPGDRRLVAYYVPRSGTQLTVEELRRFMHDRLPDYMVPPHVMELAAIPRMANGKLDTRALPQPEGDTFGLEHLYVPPRNREEGILCRIWAEMLRVERVGVYDNFFALGGHSLIAVQVIHKTRAAFGREIPLRYLFESPTVAELVERIKYCEPSVSASPQSPLVALRAREGATPLYCIHPVGGQVHLYRHVVDVIGNACAVYGLQSRALHDPATEHPSLAEMAADYARLIVERDMSKPVLVGFSTGGLFALAVAERLESMGSPARLLVLLDTHMQYASNGNMDSDSLIVLMQTLKETFGEEVDAYSNVWDGFMDNSSELYRQLSPLSQEERIGFISTWLGQFNMPEEEIREILTNQLRLHNHHFSMLKDFTPSTLHTPICAFRATEPLPGTILQPAVDWSQFTAAEVVNHEIAAHHFAILKPPFVSGIAGTIEATLELPGASHRVAVRTTRRN
jgi:amino acid adenylation domain-containing protein